MRVYTNEALIKSRAKLGKRASLIGLLVLLAGFVISLMSSIPYSFYISLACLVVGFAVSNIGVYNANQWVREPRADQALVQGLKGLSGKLALYNYTWVVPHVLLTPAGIGLFLVKSQEGKVSTSGGRWKQAFSARRLFSFFGADPLGHPERDLAMLEATAKKDLTRTLPGVDVPIRSAVLFASPKVELTLDNPAVTVLTAKQLKGWMKGFPDQESLSVEQRKTLAKAFLGSLSEDEATEVADDDESGKRARNGKK
jgi:hypothetical protein